MWRTILTIGISLVLSMAFLAACNGDDTDDGVADDPAGIADDPDGDDVPADDALTEDDDDVVGEDPDETPMATEDDAMTEDDDDALVDDDDAATDDDDMAAGETYEVTLSDHEIDMETTFEAGTVVFEITNDGDVPHGIAIQELVSSDVDAVNEDDDDAAIEDDDDAVLDDDDDDAVTNNDDDENGEAETGELIAATTVDPGDTAELEVELQEGEYVVFCPIAEHRSDEGMEEELTVE